MDDEQDGRKIGAGSNLRTGLSHMPGIPDLSDLRYLNEVGWFLYREKHGYNPLTGSYAGERFEWSVMLLDEVVGYCDRDRDWVKDKTVVTIGCSCTGDLAAWPARVKIAVDPLLYVYQKLNMLIADTPGTSPTVYLSAGVEDMPLLDECADIVICRNALDHMPDPRGGLEQIRRILKGDGSFFLSVDIGGLATPDEPSPFTMGSLLAALEPDFEVLSQTKGHEAHDPDRDYSVRLVARKRRREAASLDKVAILEAYEASIRRARSESSGQL